MTKEQYQESKKLLKEKKNKIKLYQIMLVDKNTKYKMSEDEEEQMTLLSEINILTNELTALKRNRNNSKFYEWKPFVGVNRQQRRSR